MDQAQSEPQQEATEQELRASYEQQLRSMSSSDLLLQAAVSLMNLAAQRLGLTGAPEQAERDLTQARDCIDGVRALLEILERSGADEQLKVLRESVSQLQMAYAQLAGAAPTGAPAGAPAAAQKEDLAPAPGAGSAPGQSGSKERSGEQQEPSAGAPAGTAEQPQAAPEQGAGPAQRSGRLWVPGAP